MNWIEHPILTQFLANHSEHFSHAVACVAHVHSDNVLYGAYKKYSCSCLRAHAYESWYFDLASLTKPIVARVAQEVLRSEFYEMDRPIGEIVPEYKQGIRSRVTWKHLITHASGLPSSPKPSLYDLGIWDAGKRAVASHLLSIVPSMAPGIKIQYSCTGYIVLGLALECLLGCVLEDLVRGQFDTWLGEDALGLTFKPLAIEGVTADNIVPTARKRPRRGRLRPGEVHDGNAYAMGGMSGNAGLFGTARSVCAFGLDSLCLALLQDGSTDKHVQSSAVYGGWIQARDWAPRPHWLSLDSYGHTGFTGTMIWMEPQLGLVYTLLTNSVCGFDIDGSPQERVRLAVNMAELRPAMLTLCKMLAVPEWGGVSDEG